MERRSVACALALALCLLARPSTTLAQVLEIKPDGQVATYSGPAIYASEGVQPLVPQPAQVTSSREIAAEVRESARRHGVSAPVAEAVAWQESRFRQSAISSKGARGVMQLMPETARTLGVDPFDRHGNIEGGVTYLAQQLATFGDLPRALAAYNAGPGAVVRFGGVPPFPETRAYVRSVMGRLGADIAVSSIRSEP